MKFLPVCLKLWIFLSVAVCMSGLNCLCHPGRTYEPNGHGKFRYTFLKKSALSKKTALFGCYFENLQKGRNFISDSKGAGYKKKKNVWIMNVWQRVMFVFGADYLRVADESYRWMMWHGMLIRTSEGSNENFCRRLNLWAVDEGCWRILTKRGFKLQVNGRGCKRGVLMRTADESCLWGKLMEWLRKFKSVVKP